MSAIVVRFPQIDYSKVPVQWARNLAYSYDRNAASLIPTPIEPYLIKVMQQALDKLPADRPEMRADLLAFIRQESQHYKQHQLFNDAVVAKGYPKLKEIEKELYDELDLFLKEKPLKFHLAYSEGFETLGAVSGRIWFEQSDEMLEGANPEAVALWKWHMAEEFEHREVCYQVFHAIYGRGLWNSIANGYFYRLKIFFFTMGHLRGYMQRMYNYMMEVDRAKMTDAEKQKLDDDIKAFKAFQKRTFFGPLLKVLLPWYDPGKKPMPRGLMDYLKQFEPGGTLARPGGKAQPA